jgi:hypothetical protein
MWYCPPATELDLKIIEMAEKLLGEYNHHNTAIQTARFVIDELIPNHGFAHTLMDYNNAPSTRHGDILHVLELSNKRIQQTDIGVMALA